jgi:rhomboid protease GluP
LNQYPSSSQEPSAVPEARPQQPEPRAVRVSLPTSVPYVTYSIVGLTVLVYVLQLASTQLFGYANTAAQLDWLEAYGARINDLIRAGELWRLLTPVLLHASVPHILFNMYALWVFGIGLERNFGHWRFLLLYVLGGFAGNVLSFLLSSGYSVGASTAIFGLVGAEAIFLYQNRKLFGNQFGRAISNVLFVVAVNLLLGLTPGIDNWGHVGGLIGGLIFAWFAGPVWEVQGVVPALHIADKREPREVITGAAIVILVFGALAVIGMFHPLVR